MKVAILSDQINGHLNQSLGIITLLESDYEVNVEIINIRLKNHYLRSIHQFILKHLGNNLNKKNAEKIISFYIHHFHLLILFYRGSFLILQNLNHFQKCCFG